MAKISRRMAIDSVHKVLRAYQKKIEDGRNYTEHLPYAGRQIVKRYKDNEDNYKTLLNAAAQTEEFFTGMDDETLLSYVNVCHELNKIFDLKVSESRKIKGFREETYYFEAGILYLDDEGIDELTELSRTISPLYHLRGHGKGVKRSTPSIADLSYSEKIQKAIEYSSVLNEILEEIGDVRILVAQMAAVSAVMIGLAATGYGAAAEALGFVLLAVGAAFAGRDLLAGIIELIQFFTTVDDAKSEEDLKACGKLFGDAVAKIGVDGLFFALSMFGLKKASARLTTRTVVNNGLNSWKWQGKIIKERKLRLGNRETTHSMDSSAPSKTPHARTTILNKPVKAYKTEAQITEYIKTLKVDSAQHTKLMTELAHDPKNLKRFLNRYGEEAESLIKRNGYPPKYWKSRPHHREMQIKEVWENAKKDPAKTFFEKDGIKYIRDRKGTVSWNKKLPRKGQWDMGHLKDQKYSDAYDRFLRGKMSEQEFLEWYRTAENYEPQTIPFNRGHKGE